MTFKAVLFDFDYTLGDSSHGIAECINYALGRLGYEDVAYERACQLIGMSLPEVFHQITGVREKSDEFKRLFTERADVIMVDRTMLFPTVVSVIESLRDVKLGIVTTKYRRRIEAVLDRESLRDQFAVIVGADDVAEPKPHPESLFKAAQHLGVNVEECLFVGDSIIDAEAASRAGMPFAAVLTGTTPANAFRPYKVLAMLGSLADLPTMLLA